MRELEREPDPPEGFIRFMQRALDEARSQAGAFEPELEQIIVGYRRRWWQMKSRPILLRCTWRVYGSAAVLWLYLGRQVLGSVYADRQLATFKAMPADGRPVAAPIVGPLTPSGLKGAVLALVLRSGHGRDVKVGHAHDLADAVTARLWTDRHSVSNAPDISSGDSLGPTTTEGDS